jgi:Golgi nucleoside diphosphatase
MEIGWEGKYSIPHIPSIPHKTENFQIIFITNKPHEISKHTSNMLKSVIHSIPAKTHKKYPTLYVTLYVV